MRKQTAAGKKEHAEIYNNIKISSVKIHPKKKPQNVLEKTNENVLKYNTLSKKTVSTTILKRK